MTGPCGSKTRGPDWVGRRQVVSYVPKGRPKTVLGASSWGGDRAISSHRTFGSRSGEFAVEVPRRRRGAAVNATSPRREEGLSRRRAVGGGRHGENAREQRRLITCVREQTTEGPMFPGGP